MYAYQYPRHAADDLFWHYCPPGHGTGTWVAVCRNRDLTHGVETRLCPYCGLRGTANRGNHFDFPAFTDTESMRDMWIRAIPPDLL